MNMPPLMYAMLPSPVSTDKVNARHAIIKDLLTAGAKPDGRDTEGNTPLMVAAGAIQTYAPDVESVNVVLQAGANPNQRNTTGDGPLTSMGASNLAVVRSLWAAKIDVKTPNGNGLTPMHFVCTRYFRTPANAPDDEAAKRIQLLKQAGLDINAMPSVQGFSTLGNPLFMALHEKNSDCVRALLQEGASPDSPAVIDASGNTLSLRKWLSSEGSTFLVGQKIPIDLRKLLN